MESGLRYDKLPFIQQLHNLNLRLHILNEEFGDPATVHGKNIIYGKFKFFNRHDLCDC